MGTSAFRRVMFDGTGALRSVEPIEQQDGPKHDAGRRCWTDHETGSEEGTTHMQHDEHDLGPDSLAETNSLAKEVRQLGERTTTEELGRRGVRMLRRFTLTELNELVARSVDRVLGDRTSGEESRNAVLEQTHAALAARATDDPHARIELLERRLAKLADALDRSENALAEALEDIDSGAPLARRYVDGLPDDHPLRRRSEAALERSQYTRSRSRRPTATVEELERIEQRRGMLSALAAANALPDEPAAETRAVEQQAETPRSEPASRTTGEAPPRPSAFGDMKADDLRLKMEDARPHLGYGWRSRGRR
ncbi:hypothetical protein Pla163_27300 [Planctomycetes bacterium Pla163]|uniref:Uncharacterized protein n=1 Tax=Rohdeia mirabilis TaxID=2528008 RepID=A0A518D294_9BACT|nr:hypothetical protein Pla163_27300 [Planctomycetes bacterium Pla163]